MNSTSTPIHRVLANQTLLRTVTGVTVIIAAVAVVIVPMILLRTEPAWIPLLIFRTETWHSVVVCAAAVALLQRKPWARIALIVLGAVSAPTAALSLLWLNWPVLATHGAFALAAVAAYRLTPPLPHHPPCPPS